MIRVNLASSHILFTLRMLFKVLKCHMKTPWCVASNNEPSPCFCQNNSLKFGGWWYSLVIQLRLWELSSNRQNLQENYIFTMVILACRLNKGWSKDMLNGSANMQPQTPKETTDRTKDTEHKFGAHEARRKMWCLFCWRKIETIVPLLRKVRKFGFLWKNLLPYTYPRQFKFSPLSYS